jgi:hypothetical protein
MPLSDRQSSIPEFAGTLHDLKDLMGTSSQEIIEELAFQILMNRFPGFASGTLSPAEETQLRREADELTDYLCDALDHASSAQGGGDAQHQ